MLSIEVFHFLYKISILDFPGQQYDGDDLSKIKNNTIIGDSYDNNEFE